MKRILVDLFIGLFLSWVIYVPSVLAQNLYAPSVTNNVQIGAQVGSFTVSLSGFIAPYASVVMTIDDQTIRSTVADANGYFFLSQITVQDGFDHYCLTAVDVKRLGQSKACFTITPVHANYSKTNIFLPPTLGVYKKQINAGTSGLAWGYSMPGAKVTLHLSDGRVLTTIADKDGYYEFKPPFDKPGTYELFADASYQNQNSENPVDKVEIDALSVVQQVGKTTQNVGKNIANLLGSPWGFLLLAIPILILIIILLRKLLQRHVPKPNIGAVPTGHRLPFDFLFKKHKLHHSWMKGVGY